MRTIASKAAAVIILSILSTGAKADVYTGSDYSVSDEGCYKGSGGLSLQGTSSSQSVAKCQQTCIDGQFSVMAMTSQNACYCGNSLPTSSKGDSSQCSASCFGYPSDICGSADGTYFSVWLTGYGTVGSSSSSAVSSSSPSSSTSSSTSSSSASSSSISSSSTSSTTSSVSSPSTVFITSAPTSSATSSSSGTSSAPSSEGSNTVFVTQTVENSASTSSSSSPTSSSIASATSTAVPKTGSKGVSGGAVAGIVVGCVCGISAIVGSIFFLCYRKRIKGDNERGDGGSSYFHSPQSNMTGPEDKLSFNSDTLAMAVDQRLNPVMLGRRLSEGSLADDRDYSRKILRIANPDDL